MSNNGKYIYFGEAQNEFYKCKDGIWAVMNVEFQPEGTIIRKNPEKVLKIGRMVKKTRFVPMGKDYAK